MTVDVTPLRCKRAIHAVHFQVQKIAAGTARVFVNFISSAGRPDSGKQGDWPGIAGTITGRIRAITRPEAAAGNSERRRGLRNAPLPPSLET